MNTHDIEPLKYGGPDSDDYVTGWNDCCARIAQGRQRRGEPVGYIMPTALKQLKTGGNAIVGGVSQGCDVPIYTAPQPAKSTFTTPDCPQCGCVQDGQCLCNPSSPSAEPVKQSLPTLHFLPISELRELAMRDCSKYSDDDLAIAWELFDRLVEGGRITDAIEPVKVPSDEDLLDMWDEIAGSGKSDEALEFAYALLARYGQADAYDMAARIVEGAKPGDSL